MIRLDRDLRLGLAGLGLLASLPPVRADDRVILVATATEEYSRSRIDASGQPRVESYVLMEGKTHEGIGSDRSAETMSFRQIAELLAPELAKQHYLPTRDAATADLLLVVHRGTTTPRVTVDQIRSVVAFDVERKGEVEMLGQVEVNRLMELEMREKDNDQAGDAGRWNSNSKLLGYNQQIARATTGVVSSPAESAMRTDIATERYFVIVRAYDLKGKRAAAAREPVWVLYANMSSAGQSFVTAISQMSVAANDYFGRSTDGLQTIRPGRGNVRLAPLELKDEAPASAIQPASAPGPK